MNRYKFEEIQLGMQESFDVAIKESDLKLFEQITGDKNPLHTDKTYACQNQYPGKVVYGMLTASYLSTLAGMYLPGERSLIHSVEIKFPAPLIIEGEQKLTVKGTVIELEERFKIFTLKVEIVADHRKVCRGKMCIGVR